MKRGWIRITRRCVALQTEAVSPVVGSVLILVIMIMSIAGIMAFGVPAIQGLQDYAEFQNVLTQFQELDGDVRNLRDPQNVRVSQLSLNKGSLTLVTGGRWVVAAATDGVVSYTSFSLSNWEDSDQNIRINGIQAADDVHIDSVFGSTFVRETTCTASCGSPTDLPLGDDPATTIFRIQVFDSVGTQRAEAWMLHAGRLTFKQSPESQLNQAHYEMGAVVAQQDTAYFVQQTPTVKSPDFDIGDTNLFVRMLRLDILEGSVSGKGRHAVVTNLIDNYGEARGRPSFADTAMVRLQIDSELEGAFCSYFSGRGWTVVGDCVTAAGESVDVQYVPPVGETMRFDLIHSEVDASVRTV